jgi:hypothetical protein
MTTGGRHIAALPHPDAFGTRTSSSCRSVSAVTPSASATRSRDGCTTALLAYVLSPCCAHRKLLRAVTCCTIALSNGGVKFHVACHHRRFALSAPQRTPAPSSLSSLSSLSSPCQLHLLPCENSAHHTLWGNGSHLGPVLHTEIRNLVTRAATPTDHHRRTRL